MTYLGNYPPPHPVDAANVTGLEAAIAGARSNGEQVHQGVFTADGVWNRNAVLSLGAKYTLIELWGGAGGGARDAANSVTEEARGGEGGYYSRIVNETGSLPETVPITIGVGGAGSTITDVQGDDGLSTTFGALFDAVGGRGGLSDQQNNSDISIKEPLFHNPPSLILGFSLFSEKPHFLGISGVSNTPEIWTDLQFAGGHGGSVRDPGQFHHPSTCLTLGTSGGVHNATGVGADGGTACGGGGGRDGGGKGGDGYARITSYS